MSVTEIKITEGRLRRILAPNPSPMTAEGTNSYLLGEGACVLIDPGPDLAAHRHAILGALGGHETIAAILVTHPHLDHSEGARILADLTAAPVYAFGGAFDGRSPAMRARATDCAGLGADLGFVPDHCLTDGARLSLGDVALEALHTPGHMGAHLCFAWGRSLFSGDHIMAWAPSVVAPPEGDMGDYMVSLARLQAGEWEMFLPGHGAPITDPAARMSELRAHRLMRESQLRAALAQGPSDLGTLRARIYPDLDAVLARSAEANLSAHFLNLVDRGEIPLNHWAHEIFDLGGEKKH